MFDKIIDEILAYYRQQIYDLMAAEPFIEKHLSMYAQRLVDCRYEQIMMMKEPDDQAMLTGFIYTEGKDRVHTVVIKENGMCDCSCENFTYRMRDTSGYCKHIITTAFIFAGSSHIEQQEKLNEPF